MQDLLVDLLKANRHQRHDFLNHLQVLWGYLKLNNSDRAVEYTQDVVAYLRGLQCLNNIASVELAADISTKVLEIGLQPNLSLSISENFTVEENKIKEIRILLDQIWPHIKEILFVQDGKIELKFIKDKIIINLNSENAEIITQWERIKEKLIKNDLHSFIQGKQLIINLIN